MFAHSVYVNLKFIIVPIAFNCINIKSYILVIHNVHKCIHAICIHVYYSAVQYVYVKGKGFSFP